MRLVFAGTPEVAVPALDALAASPHTLLAVLTRPDTVAGRGRRSVRSPVARWAEEREIPVLRPDRPGDPGFLDELAALAPDCVPVVAYGALLPRTALDVPRYGWVNLHFSLLPAWRGAAPVQRALIAGDEITGATTFAIEEGLDTGPVYGHMTERIRATDTAGDLLARLAEGGAQLLRQTLDGIADGSLSPQPQSSDDVSLAPKIMAEDARIDWTRPAWAVDRQVRGCTPAPGAWTTFRGERVKLGPVTPLTPAGSGPGPGPGDGPGTSDGAAGPAPAPAPGEIRSGRREVLVGTATGPVRLGTVQPPGRRAVPAADWARGARPEPGETFG
jgi:methionyl-tRNA formyltransferase